ncbi:hypothetical protein AKJ16_DCAP17497 [Drosera capensis]
MEDPPAWVYELVGYREYTLGRRRHGFCINCLSQALVDDIIHDGNHVLSPLIEELKFLWEVGKSTSDARKRQTFNMKARFLWTISDFPTYGMLSGWNTVGCLACPYCMENTKSFHFKHGGKHSWFDCHLRFLPMDHSFRRNKSGFLKNKTEFVAPVELPSGDEIFQWVSTIPIARERLMYGLSATTIGFHRSHNWSKKSILGPLLMEAASYPS